MILNLTQELAAALESNRHQPIEVVDPASRRTYVLVDSETHQLAMEALRRQQDREAIAEGLAQMQAGGGTELDAAFARMRVKLGFPPRS